MTPWESLQVALEAIAANRLRSILTMLGIIFGVGAVIAAVSLTEGAKAATLERFTQFGTNTLTIRPGQERRGPVAAGEGTQNTLTVDDGEALVREVDEVTAVAPQVNGRRQVIGGGQNTSTSITGTTAACQQVESYKMAEGAFFTDEDVDRNSKVAVVGPTVVKNLFGEGASAVGRKIRIGRTSFRIVGVFVSKGGQGFRDPDDVVIVPITTAIRSVLGATEGSTTGKETVSSLMVQITGMEAAEKARAAITELLRDRHGLKRDEPDDFHIMAVADIVQGAQEANKILTLLFGSIAAVSLLVGGIGIMNIMLVSVTERTREIGLRKAVGATPTDIMRQFLIESLTLSLAGGLLGALFGSLSAPIVGALGLNAKLSPPWIVISLTFAAVVGIVFGLLPARKAATMDPVEALRYE